MNRIAKGCRAEHRSIELLQQEGYACIRSAASKGAFDVVAIGREDVLLIQCKCTRWPSAGRAGRDARRGVPQQLQKARAPLARSLHRARRQGTVKRLCVSKTKTNGAITPRRHARASARQQPLGAGRAHGRATAK